MRPIVVTVRPTGTPGLGTAVLPWLAVAIGAAIGTSARYGLDLLLPHPLDGLPWSTIIANTAGSLALGLLVGGAWTRLPAWLRTGLGAGVLGSFTTFSSLMIVAVATAQGGVLAHGPGSIEPGSIAQAVAVLVGSLFVGLLAALLGILAGRRLGGRRLEAAPEDEA